MFKMIKKMLLVALFLGAAAAPVQEVKAISPLLDFCVRWAGVCMILRGMVFVDEKTGLSAKMAALVPKKYIPFKMGVLVPKKYNPFTLENADKINKYNPVYHAKNLLTSGDSRMETINPM